LYSKSEQPFPKSNHQEKKKKKGKKKKKEKEDQKLNLAWLVQYLVHLLVASMPNIHIVAVKTSNLTLHFYIVLRSD